MPAASPEFAVAKEFQLAGSVIDVHRFGHGLIHDTYLVTTDAEQVILQRVNRRAFPQPELIMHNLRVLHDHVRAVGTDLRLPPVIVARDGRDFVLDQNGDFWRALGFIENTETFVTIRDATQAGEVGAALGQFHALVGDLDPQRLHVTRPGFHQTPQYYARFAEAEARPRATRDVHELTWCLAFAHARRGMVSVLEQAKQSGELQNRVIHGDPKLDNFLFSPETGLVESLIDLDTVQPGLLHYDVGDCLRSCANPAGESPQDAAHARFHLDLCESMLTRYFEETRGLLSAHDIAHFYDAMRLIPFELGLRFLTDHLEGDVYFRTSWRGQNLHRALVQFRLTADVERSERQIRTLIADLSGEGA